MSTPVALLCTFSDRLGIDDHLMEMLSSVYEQDHPDLQLVLVADGISDRLHDLINQSILDFAATNPDRNLLITGNAPIAKINQEISINDTLIISSAQISKVGRATALNHAMTLLHPEVAYCALLDSDDYLTEPHAVSFMVERLKAQGASLAYSDRVVINGSTRRHEAALPGISWNTAIKTNYPFHFSLWDRELFQPVNEKLDYAVDYDMMLKILEQHPKTCHVGHSLYAYRLHLHQMSANQLPQFYAAMQTAVASIERVNPQLELHPRWVIRDQSSPRQENNGRPDS